MNRDVFYMQIALDLAAKGLGTASPNPAVGAVVVKDGRIVGRGYHAKAGGPHAEAEALRQAGSRAEGADLYVTLEPCNHTGKTPPCAIAIREAGIRRVVSAMADPNPHVAGGGHAWLSRHGITVVTGVCESEARRLNEAFITHVRTGLPLVLLKIAATLDGRIATRTGHSRWVTGEASRRFVHRLRHQVDAIMVGVGTVRADNPSLTARLENGDGADPLRIILDTRLSIPADAKLLHQVSSARTIVVTGKDVSQAACRRITSTGADILQVDTNERGIDLNPLMKQLGAMAVTSILIEGGSRVAASALAAGIVDKLYLFYAPKLMGGDDGVPVFRGPGPADMTASVPVKQITIHRFDDDILVEGYLEKGQPAG